MSYRSPLPCMLYGSVLVLLSSGCAALDFDRDFDVAVAHGAMDERTGPWDGTWRSDVDGDHGSLRCIVRESGLNQYEARFKAIHDGITPYVYTGKMRAVEDGNGVLMTGRANLPVHGTYDWTGRIIGDTFTADYRTKRDEGTFTMTRSGRAPVAR